MTLNITPNELIFHGTGTELSATMFILENYGTEKLAYRIRTQNKSYYIKPHKGFIDPSTTIHVQITFKPHKETNRQPINVENKLKIQYINVSNVCDDDFETFWEQYTTKSDNLEELFLKCRFVADPSMTSKIITKKVDIGVQTSDMVSFFQNQPTNQMSTFTPKPSRRSKIKSLFSHKRSSSGPTRPPRLPIDEQTNNVSFYMIFQQSYAPFQRDKININVTTGDLKTTMVDAIVIPQSSGVLLVETLKVLGQSIINQYQSILTEHPDIPLVIIEGVGLIKPKKIYIFAFELTSDPLQMRDSIRNLVQEVFKQAANDRYQTIAFPAIGCGNLGCSSDLIAHIMIQEVSLCLEKYKDLSVSFVILPESIDILQRFERKLELISQVKESSGFQKSISLSVGQGSIVIEKGNLTTPILDSMINMSLPDNLKNSVFIDAHKTNITVYNHQSDSILFSITSDQLAIDRIYFTNWRPTKNLSEQQTFYLNLMSIIIERFIAGDFTYITLPILNCNKNEFSSEILARILFHVARRRISKMDFPLSIKFLVKKENDAVYQIFREQMFSVLDTNHSFELESTTTSHMDFNVGYNLDFPSTWQYKNDDEMSFELGPSSKEYNEVLNEFNRTMLNHYKNIIGICRIQNERCYLQYMIHSQELRKQLKIDTEMRLFHGCPNEAVESIIKNGFNRSFAGTNGTYFGIGVYFSIYAVYSHSYASPDKYQNRYMLLSRVLIGKTCAGDRLMKAPKEGCHSSSNGHDIFVTYHDAQAYPEYLIIYE